MRWYGHVERSTGWIAEVYKLNVVAQKRPRAGRLRKTWAKVLLNVRKKLGMVFADPQNRSEWIRRIQGRLVRQASPLVGLKNGMVIMTSRLIIQLLTTPVILRILFDSPGR